MSKTHEHSPETTDAEQATKIKAVLQKQDESGRYKYVTFDQGKILLHNPAELVAAIEAQTDIKVNLESLKINRAGSLDDLAGLILHSAKTAQKINQVVSQ